MNEQNHPTRMEQRIFEIGLPVETVSVYLLCTGLSDSDADLTLDALRSVWNGEDDTLLRELNALVARGILTTSADDPFRYRVQPAQAWI